MNSRYKKLIKNTAIFSVGSFGSKVLNFLIVPLYTYLLTTEEYGTIDLFLTSISFIVPIITLQVQEALIRFLLGKEIKEEVVLSNSLCVYIIGLVLIVAMYSVYLYICGNNILSLIFIILILTNSFNTMFLHYLKSVGKNIEYALQGVISTVTFLGFNIIFLLILKKGMYGYLYSNVCSQIICVVFILIAGELLPKLNLKSFDLNSLRLMLKYSIPLIPNSLMWWVMSAGDKYIINWFLGSGANGIYALSLKIPTVISMFYSLFFQAWQISAIEENNNNERKVFYETVYNTTNALLVFLIVGIIIFVKPVYVLLMNKSFCSAWVYVPFLALGTAFSCQSSLFGVVYTTSKKTEKAFFTTVFGACVNLLFNIVFVKIMGLQGIAVGTCLGYMAVSLIRANDAKKEIQMGLDIKRTSIAVLALVFQSVISINCGNFGIITSGISVFVVELLLYKKEMSMIMQKIVIRKKL